MDRANNVQRATGAATPGKWAHWCVSALACQRVRYVGGCVGTLARGVLACRRIGCRCVGALVHLRGARRRVGMSVRWRGCRCVTGVWHVNVLARWCVGKQAFGTLHIVYWRVVHGHVGMRVCLRGECGEADYEIGT
jgi:hypothetical protein